MYSRLSYSCMFLVFLITFYFLRSAMFASENVIGIV